MLADVSLGRQPCEGSGCAAPVTGGVGDQHWPGRASDPRKPQIQCPVLLSLPATSRCCSCCWRTRGWSPMPCPPSPLLKYLHIKKKKKEQKGKEKVLACIQKLCAGDGGPLGLVTMVTFPGQRPLLQGRGWLWSWVPAWALSCPALGMLSVPKQIILAPVFPPGCGFGTLAWMLLASLWGAPRVPDSS